MRRGWLTLSCGLVLVASVVACSDGGPERAGPPAAFIGGVVVDEAGRPIVGAVLESGGAEVRSDRRGRFRFGDPIGPGWVRAEADGFLSRTRAGRPGDEILFRLTQDPGDAISLHFAGDVMVGRRFYDRNEDGNPDDGLLPLDADVRAHRALLADVEPLLSDAMLSIVNLESPLTPEPWYPLTGARPAAFHSTKDFAFASAPSLAEALRDAGVDVVDLGNNHLYDRLEDGIVRTVGTLDAAGLSHFGAGRNADEAWRPAIVSARGRRIAFLGCTSILGDEHDVTYVATATKGGAAECEMGRIDREVRLARGQDDLVVFMVHGGFEYEAVPSGRVAEFTATARRAGAAIVVNHHPHVIGGLDWDGASLAALNLGNFLFDQTIWQTFQGYLLDVDVVGGRIARAYGEPLLIDNYTPTGITGSMAADVSRVVAGMNPGPYVMEDGVVEVDIAGSATTIDRLTEAPADAILRVTDHHVLGEEVPPATRVGRDLLWIGRFDDEDVDPNEEDADLWEVQLGRRIGYAYGRRGLGMRIERAVSDTTPAYLNPLHRILLNAGAEVSLLGRVRAGRGSEVSVQLSWYTDTKGPSGSQTVSPVPATPAGRWTAFRLDAVAPPGTVAVGVFLRLAPPSSAGPTEQTADFDDLALVAWDAEGTIPTPRHGYLRTSAPETVATKLQHLPGGAAWAATLARRPALEPVP